MCFHSYTGNESVTLNGGTSSASTIITVITSSTSQNGSTSNPDNLATNNERISWSAQSELDANNLPKNQEKSNGGNVVSCTILLNDVEKKSDLLLPSNNQPNCIDENFSDKDKTNADENNSNSCEFVYKNKNRNSGSVTKIGGGGGGGKPRQQKQHQQQHNNNNQSANNNVVGADAMQNASNGCQSQEYLSVENSTDHFTDQSGVDLLQFFKITLNKNAKDRYMLLRVEKELAALAQDQR